MEINPAIGVLVKYKESKLERMAPLQRIIPISFLKKNGQYLKLLFFSMRNTEAISTIKICRKSPKSIVVDKSKKKANLSFPAQNRFITD